jgi:hypothetical protein
MATPYDLAKRGRAQEKGLSPYLNYNMVLKWLFKPIFGLLNVIKPF